MSFLENSKNMNLNDLKKREQKNNTIQKVKLEYDDNRKMEVTNYDVCVKKLNKILMSRSPNIQI